MLVGCAAILFSSSALLLPPVQHRRLDLVQQQRRINPIRMTEAQRELPAGWSERNSCPTTLHQCPAVAPTALMTHALLSRPLRL